MYWLKEFAQNENYLEHSCLFYLSLLNSRVISVLQKLQENKKPSHFQADSLATFIKGNAV